MDKLEEYRNLVKKLIIDYANTGTSKGDVERQVIFDIDHDHYQLVNVGWDNRRRVYGCVLHFDIKDGKIWLQYNGTEIDFATELVKLGVPNQDIVIGFHSIWMRSLTEYATG
ncbi:XisI protein [Nostoc sp. FACHB-973]|nr:XisI protein [Nostoc sp. FACHB-973]